MCMVPLIHLDGDEIVEALLLGPTDNGPGMFPTTEEEAVLLGDVLEHQEAQKATTYPCEHLGAPEHKDPDKQSDTIPACPLSHSVQLQ